MFLTSKERFNAECPEDARSTQSNIARSAQNFFLRTPRILGALNFFATETAR
jgi:hypothetical protein